MISQRDRVKVREMLSLGRAYVLHRAEYYASMLLRMHIEIVDDPEITLGITRGLVLYVGAPWMLTDPELQDEAVIGGCLVHECEHPLRGLDRLDALPDAERANIAGDIAINGNLQKEKWKLPSWVIYASHFGFQEGLSLEQYYALLSQEQQNTTLVQYMEKALKAPWKPRIGSGGCGSGGGYAPKEELEKRLDETLGKSDAEVESIRRETIQDIERAMSRGDTPGRFQELLEHKHKKPEVNWKQLLRRAGQHSLQIISGASDYSMARPSIGSQLVGYIGAGLIDRRPETIIIEDTSASMGAPQLQAARIEGYNVLRTLGLDVVTLMQVDTQVAHVQQVRLRQLPKLAYTGRGGTDFRPAFEYIKQKLPRATLCIYFTDGDGRAPKVAPKGLQVIWCIVRTPYARKPAHWGTTVVCDKEQRLRPPL